MFFGTHFPSSILDTRGGGAAFGAQQAFPLELGWGWLPRSGTCPALAPALLTPQRDGPTRGPRLQGGRRRVELMPWPGTWSPSQESCGNLCSAVTEWRWAAWRLVIPTPESGGMEGAVTWGTGWGEGCDQSQGETGDLRSPPFHCWPHCGQWEFEGRQSLKNLEKFPAQPSAES